MVIVASSWFFYITLPILRMHGETQIKSTTPKYVSNEISKF